MLCPRTIDPNRDKDLVLEFHCRINYECESWWAKELPYDQYRQKWLNTSQPAGFFSSLIESMSDKRTIAEIWEINGLPIAYPWVTFTDVEDYDFTFAEINDMAVRDQYQRKGIGTRMFEHIEQLARERGAQVLRSETGIENKVSEYFHRQFGFKPYRIRYEKLLVERPI